MNAGTAALVGLLLIAFVMLVGCWLHDKAEEKGEAQRKWQRAQDAAMQQEVAMRVRKYNAMHAMRRTARRHRER
ncbi:hypothetical protein AB0H92_01455 [Streptomyces phaeochromogenes]|uniref:hypothetical protein n=1 Tax=Streptomyces phaeochromogenes TaxID=1923 RepID=UPI0033D523EF